MINLKKISSEYLFAIFFFVFSTVLEAISLLTITKGGACIPKYFLYDFAIICVICGLLILIRNKAINSIITLLFLTLQAVLNVVNSTLFKVFGYVFDYSMLNLGQEGRLAFDAQFVNWFSFALNAILLIFAIYIVCEICRKAETKKIHYNFKTILSVFVIFFAFQTTGLSSLLLAKTTMVDAQESSALYIAESDVYLYEHMQFSLEAYKKFGYYGYYLKTLENIVTSSDSLTEQEKTEYIAYLESGKVSADNSKLLNGDNLIMIMLESFEWFAIDPYNTPTLYSLKENQTVCYDEFYVWNKTNVSEEISLLGNIPQKHTLISLSQAQKLDPQYSLPNLFKNCGYTTNYFHSYSENFYQRHKINADFGFEKVIGLESTNLPNKNDTLKSFGVWQREIDFLDDVIDKFAPTDKPFFSFYTTVGTHGSYENLNPLLTDLAEIYDSNFENLSNYYQNETNYIMPTDSTILNYLKNYKVAAMDTDRMVQYLLNYLQEKNLLNNTTIVLFADHNSYYHDLSSFLKFGNNSVDEYSSEVYNIPFMIYSQKLTPQKKDMFCSTYDIYPTVCDLFGLEYNTNLTQGYSTFSSEINKTIFVSSITGIFTNKLYSKNILDVYDFKNANISEDEIFNFQLNAVNYFKKQEKIDKIYFNNLHV